MNDVKRVSLPRCLLIWLVATIAAVALVWWAASDLADAREALAGNQRLPPFDRWLTWLCALAIVLCAAWCWLMTSAVVLEALTHRSPRAPAPGVPAWTRRLVLSACSVAALGSAVPAVAASGHLDPDSGAPRSVLEGLPLPDRAEGGSVSEVVARAIASTTPVSPSEHHLVRPGDSLWAIAEAALRRSGSPATGAEVAAYWPRIYALNRALVGEDPDLLRAGQLLRLSDLPLNPTPREDLR